MEKSDEELEECFHNAAEYIQQSIQENKLLDTNTLLELYSYYKQSIEGQCHTEKPSFWNISATKKWSYIHSIK